MLALPKSRPGRKALLGSYTAAYGAALRRSRSLVSLQAAKVDAELAYRARGAFLASMNHELRTPLNAITGFAGLLKSADLSAMPDERRDEYLDYILQSAELLLSHLDMILEIAAAESGGGKISRRAFDLRDVLRQVTEPMAEGGGLTLDMPRMVPLVDADPDKVATALSHLFAVLGVEEGIAPPMTLSVRSGLAGKSAGFVYVAIECRTKIITPEELNSAFRMLEHVEEGLDRKFDARHLGLPIAKSFIELNGGKFNVKSDPEVGTLVRFALPIAQDEHQSTYDQLAS